MLQCAYKKSVSDCLLLLVATSNREPVAHRFGSTVGEINPDSDRGVCRIASKNVVDSLPRQRIVVVSLKWAGASPRNVLKCSIPQW